MKIEYEATFTNIDKDEIRKKLRGINARLTRPEFLQKRINLYPPKGSAAEKGWMRVRDEGEKTTMSLKMIEQRDTMDGQKELDFEVDDFQEAKTFLEMLGCVQKTYQETKREVWEVDDVEICIDEWPWLEPFVEIEGTSEELVRSVSEKLGLDYEQALFDSVDAQYARKYGISRQRINNETPRFVFGEPCPFE